MGFGKDGMGVILWDFSTITPGALAAKDVASISSHSSLIEDFRIIKIEWFFARDVADNAQAHCLVGLAAGGLTAAEIEEALESAPIDSFDRPASEQTMRPVWPLSILGTQGFLQTNESSSVGTLSDRGEKTIRWTMPNTVGWSWWCYNITDTAFTTGDRIFVAAKIFGVWVR